MGLDISGIRSSAETGFFLLPLGPAGLLFFIVGVKRHYRQTEHPPAPNAEITNVWSHTTAPATYPQDLRNQTSNFAFDLNHNFCGPAKPVLRESDACSQQSGDA
jgi:hypothetical protein